MEILKIPLKRWLAAFSISVFMFFAVFFLQFLFFSSETVLEEIPLSVVFRAPILFAFAFFALVLLLKTKMWIYALRDATAIFIFISFFEVFFISIVGGYPTLKQALIAPLSYAVIFFIANILLNANDKKIRKFGSSACIFLGAIALIYSLKSFMGFIGIPIIGLPGIFLMIKGILAQRKDINN